MEEVPVPEPEPESEPEPEPEPESFTVYKMIEDPEDGSKKIKKAQFVLVKKSDGTYKQNLDDNEKPIMNDDGKPDETLLTNEDLNSIISQLKEIEGGYLMSGGSRRRRKSKKSKRSSKRRRGGQSRKHKRRRH
jgi:hypothetical protein